MEGQQFSDDLSFKLNIILNLIEDILNKENHLTEKQKLYIQQAWTLLAGVELSLEE